MEKWKIYAFAAAIFAGVTSVVAKAGLKDISADFGLAIRTAFVLVFVIGNLLVWRSADSPISVLRSLEVKSIAWLALSALTTTLSWVCYYRAMKEGAVSFVSLVDKGSLLVTLALSVWFLGEPLTWRIGVGAALIVAGLLILAGGR